MVSESSHGISPSFSSYSTQHCRDGVGVQRLGVVRKGPPNPYGFSGGINGESLLALSHLYPRGPHWRAALHPSSARAWWPLSWWLLAPGAASLLVDSCQSPAHGLGMCCYLVQELSSLQPFFHLTSAYRPCTLLDIVANKERPYVMSIVVMHKSIAVCLGGQWSLNLLPFTVWSLSAQWTASLFATIVPHSLKHLSLKSLQRQINCHCECKPANREMGAGLENTEFSMKSKRSCSRPWKTCVRSLVLFKNPQEKPAIPLPPVMVLPGILHETLGPLEGPEFLKAPQRAWAITDVNICKNPFCLGADGNLHPIT